MKYEIFISANLIEASSTAPFCSSSSANVFNLAYVWMNAAVGEAPGAGVIFDIRLVFMYHWNFSHILHWFIQLRTFIVNIRLWGHWEGVHPTAQPSAASEPDERRNILSVFIRYRCRVMRCAVLYHSEVLNYRARDINQVDWSDADVSCAYVFVLSLCPVTLHLIFLIFSSL